MMLSTFKERLRFKTIRNFRFLNVFAAMIVTAMGFLFEFAYHDGYIMASGLAASIILTSNYFLSFYSRFYRKHFVNISYASVFMLHFWAVYVAYMRNFEIAFLLPVSISIFTFSLIFDKFYKTLAFIFVITTFMLVMMFSSKHWQPEFTITLIALYSGAFVSDQILKRKEEYHAEIRNQELRYLALVESMNDGLTYFNIDDQLVYVNDKFSQIIGYDKNEILGKSITELLPDKVTDKREPVFSEEIKKGSSFHTEKQILKRNGEKIWVQMTGAPFFDDRNRKIGTMVVYSDITVLKNTQDTLKKREEGYRTFIDQSAVGIWRAEYKQPIPVNLPVSEQVDLLLETGVISECNDFMAQMYGYSGHDELVGRKIRDFYHIENNLDEEKTREIISTFVRNKYRIINAESKERDMQGNIRYMLNNNIGIVENGHLIRTWGVQTEISDRKRTERELQETNQELDTFFYKASHDLKGPLASVMGIVNLARLESKDPVLAKYFGMIDTSIKRLDRTLHDLIELARTRRGNSKLSTINIKEFVNEILGSLKHLPEFDQINFEIKIDNQIEITADKVLLLSVIQNLVHNAINYCNRQRPWIRIRADETDDELEFEISDNGRGIPEQVKSRVFEMFYRGHQESTGSGLGLFIVKNALDKMNGQIRFESQAGNGTSFFVNIPRILVET